MTFLLNTLTIGLLWYTIPLIIIWYGHNRLKTDKDKTASRIRFYASIIIALGFVYTITMTLISELRR
jgi:hypothetical protein